MPSRSRRAERPVGQASVDNSTSYFEKTITWPASTYNALEFDYGVDSEANYDFLRVLIDGVVVASWSGLARSGHHEVDVSSGPHVVRFEYIKDISLSHGADTAWVDSIRAKTKWGTIEEHRFDERNSTLAGWTSGGTNGSWSVRYPRPRRIIRRPSSQAFSGYIPAATKSSLQRSISFSGTSTNVLVFDYVVDSEPNYDYFRVYVDGVQQIALSGVQSGIGRLNVATGTHLIKFEYNKDTSVDSGRDTAMVGSVFAVCDGATTEWHSFEGAAPNTVPTGWQAAGTDTSWVAADPAPERVYVSTSSFTAPTIDGVIGIGATEYANPTIVQFRETIATTNRPGTLLLRATAADVFVGVRAMRATDAVGGETGVLTLLFDANRDETLRTKGCDGVGILPGAEDRKIVINYASGTPWVTQYMGNCSGWTNAGASAWPLTVALTEPSTDPGYKHIEVKVSPGPNVIGQGRLGFAAAHENTVGTLTRELFPLDYSYVLNDIDVAQWTTVDLAAFNPGGSGIDHQTIAWPWETDNGRK